jgi:hypothetical protein
MLRPERRHHGHGDTRCWDECSQRPSNHLAFSLHHGADPDRFAERAAIWEQDLATGGRRADASGLRNPNAVSVGQHGLWRPRPHSGYRVIFVPFEGVLPTGGPPLASLTRRAGPTAGPSAWPSTDKVPCWWPMTWAMWSGVSLPQEGQQGLVELGCVGDVQSVRCPRDSHHLAVGHGAVGALA